MYRLATTMMSAAAWFVLPVLVAFPFVKAYAYPSVRPLVAIVAATWFFAFYHRSSISLYGIIAACAATTLIGCFAFVGIREDATLEIHLQLVAGTMTEHTAENARTQLNLYLAIFIAGSVASYSALYALAINHIARRERVSAPNRGTVPVLRDGHVDLGPTVKAIRLQWLVLRFQLAQCFVALFFFMLSLPGMFLLDYRTPNHAIYSAYALVMMGFIFGYTLLLSRFAIRAATAIVAVQAVLATLALFIGTSTKWTSLGYEIAQLSTGVSLFYGDLSRYLYGRSQPYEWWVGHSRHVSIAVTFCAGSIVSLPLLLLAQKTLRRPLGSTSTNSSSFLKDALTWLRRRNLFGFVFRAVAGKYALDIETI